jgi:hypothetical protein
MSLEDWQKVEYLRLKYAFATALERLQGHGDLELNPPGSSETT